MNDEEVNENSDLFLEPHSDDEQPPFSPPSDLNDQLDPTHQATDNASDIDLQQFYDEGLAGAAEASEPNQGSAVLGYNPEAKHKDS